MQDAFNNPPATVYDCLVDVVSRFGTNFDDMPPSEQAVWIEAVTFICTCVAGRFSSVVPNTELCRPGRRASDCAASKIQAETLKMMQEVHFLSQRLSTAAPAATN